MVWILIGGLQYLATLGAAPSATAEALRIMCIFIGVSIGLHVVISIVVPQSSEVLLPIVLFLNGIGEIEIERWNPPRAMQQMTWFVISSLIVVGALLIVRSAQDLDRYRYLTLAGAIFLMLTPFIPHFGENINGARLWVHFGPLSFQPVEIAKILLAFFFASYFAANRDLLSTPTQRIGQFAIVPPKTLVPILIAWGIALLILGAQNDVGFAMMLFTLFFALLWVSTGRKTYVFLGLGLFAIGGYFGNELFHQVHSRITQWLDPWSTVNFAHSSQIAYGWFSLAAGGVTGTGLGYGQSGNIGEITSDMIFAALGEELGLIGIVLIVSLFALFVAEGFRIAQQAHSDFLRLASAALAATIGLQAFFIMAGVLRLVPFTGITLPFMAYGGSSLFANYLILALLLRISHESASERRGGSIVAVTFS